MPFTRLARLKVPHRQTRVLKMQKMGEALGPENHHNKLPYSAPVLRKGECLVLDIVSQPGEQLSQD